MLSAGPRLLVLLLPPLLYLAPSTGPVAPVTALLRYALAAYLPGLVVWRARSRRESGLVDTVLLPPLLGLLPYCACAAGAMAAGATARAAAWAALVPFAIAAPLFVHGRLARPRAEVAAVVLAGLLALTLVALPLAASSFAASAWDGPLHAAVATRVLLGHVPPDSPFVAGEPVNYYWLYHLWTALVSALSGLSIEQSFALVSVHALALLVLAGWRLAGRLTTSPSGRLVCPALLVFGLNPLGWMLWLGRARGYGDPFFSLLVPFVMAPGEHAPLASLIHQFLDGSPFPVSFAFELHFLDRLLGWLDGERSGESRLSGALALMGALHLHLMGGALLALSAAVAAVLALLLKEPRETSARLRAAAVPMVLALLASLPYAVQVMHGRARTGPPMRIDLGAEFVAMQGLSLLASAGLLAALALPALAGTPRFPQRVLLWIYVSILATAAIFTRVAGGAQYKLVYLAWLALAPLCALAFESWWSRSGTRRAAFGACLALAAPTTLLTSSAFLLRPPADAIDPDRLALLAWMRSETPPESVFVEQPYWVREGAPREQALLADRRFFDVPVRGLRRQLVGYGDIVLQAQWGYRDIPRRLRLAGHLIEGRPLNPGQRAYLAALGVPLYVVVRAPRAEGFERPDYRLVWEAGALRVYAVS